MKSKLLIFMLLLSAIAVAQLPKSIIKPTERVSTYDEFNGSIYLSSRYKKSSVTHEKSGSFDVKLRYNIFDDVLEFTSNEQLFQVSKKTTIHARIDDDYFYYCNFKNERGVGRNGYYVLVELSDDYRIYKKFTLEIRHPENNALTGVMEPGMLTRVTTYYIEEAGVIMELPMNKKGMLATFNDKAAELKKYMKKKRIRLSKEDDLIQLVARYNALKNIDATPSRSLLGNRGQNN